ncbi:MAG: 3-oxoacyl-[acyl-carrier-protein] reductase [Anaerolineae bacterium]
MSDLSGRVALVTGAGKGIGRAVALELARRGATVAINDLTGNNCESTIQAVEEAGGVAVCAAADVSDFAQAEAMIKEIVDACGKLDILVNNAGTTRDNLIIRMSEDEWDLIMRVNLKSAWNCAKAAVRPMMRQRYGRIVNMASVSGIAGQAGQTNYSASKAGLIGFTKALAREVASRNITVNAVAPGFVLTDLTRNLPQQMGESAMAQLNAAIPMGRWAEVEDVAYAVAFFCAEEAGYITGQVLSVDGGMVMG